ncbi:hypothetical protein FZEAL_2128 [Fusarium zealandicum]|uniref:Zinc finger C2H2 LYAR-type domain-containing protein n=1 Tax=Fusarium zealandicum TaxID=1053134 RepID=A0A8H4URH5_9HYPO|nr:hypothetical protein FZEAL_2128 [Fusarium zealandicum]
MVSFSCEACGDVLTKKKLDPHRNRCRGATFTCIDCMVHFPGVQYRSHTSCMTEDQKYQGALYKDNKNNKNKKQKHSHPNYNPTTPQTQAQVHAPAQTQTAANLETGTMAHHAYVEDFPDDRDYAWAEYDDSSDDDSPSGPMPEAPTPPSAAPEPHVDVFEFLVNSGQTPNASTMNLTTCQELPDAEPSTSLVRYEPPAEDYVIMEDDDDDDDDEPAAQFITPAPKSERRTSKSSTEKKDKKRKRLHVDVPNDEVMTDAPPVLHSGLTGGLNRMMHVFPPSPDYSGGDAPEVSPASPLKKKKHSKHSKHAKSAQAGHSIFGLISGSTKTKSKTKTKTSKSSKPKKTSSSSKKHSQKEKKPQLIEYRPHSRDGKIEPGENQVILFKPRADVFLSFVDKGPDSDRGCSMNKVLKRFHREREATGSELGKGKEEKELWRSLRLRENERGEVVLFSVE